MNLPETFFAHTKELANGQPAPQSDWELLYSGQCGEDCSACHAMSLDHGHLNKVAYWTARFAEDLFESGSSESISAKQWGRILGLWHDLGKFSDEFQQRLKGEIARADHSTAGAKYLAEHGGPFGQLMAYLIAGHHAGLADWNGNGSMSDLSERLQNDGLPNWRENCPPEILEQKEFPAIPCPPSDIQGAAFLARFLFSCLVDADFLATEFFMNPVQGGRRAIWPDGILNSLADMLDLRFKKFGPAETEVNRQREYVRESCMAAADKEKGLFTLTVPTGGGKTLSSLAFALKHAIKHKLNRVIYVVPYTSIIEQNAEEFRKVFETLSCELGQEVVLEHHSNFEGKDGRDGFEKPVWKLASENWNAPLIVTTSVQFFESLYANKTSRCRKLHNIARSVIILDEAQNLPVEFLNPCLTAIKQLTDIAGCSVVLCTATQPAIYERPEQFPIGLKIAPDREIMPDPKALYEGFRRVTIKPLQIFDDAQIVEALSERDRVLCIVNTKRHAQNLFDLLGSESPENLHLSAQMCPAHRQRVLAEVRRRETENQPCRLITTTVVEAGVDIDFPSVYRAMTGLDSFAQAAGRCNRHGKLSRDEAHVVLFETVDAKTPRFLTQNVNAAQNVLPDYEDLLGLDVIEAFFEQYYFLKGRPFRWDKENVMGCFDFQNKNQSPLFLFQYKSAAKAFRLIPDTQKAVIIEPKLGLWPDMDDEKAEQVRTVLDELRDRDRYGLPPPRNAYRILQRYTVQIPTPMWLDAERNGEIQLYCEHFPILIHPENKYCKKVGLNLDSNEPSAFMI